MVFELAPKASKNHGSSKEYRSQHHGDDDLQYKAVAQVFSADSRSPLPMKMEARGAPP